MSEYISTTKTSTGHPTYEQLESIVKALDEYADRLNEQPTAQATAHIIANAIKKKIQYGLMTQ
jgi:hypothetical protein